jgi:hypothetical protein
LFLKGGFGFASLRSSSPYQRAPQFVKVDTRKRISQETFDSVVKENMDDFAMDAEEAVADAIQQFLSQGVDLSCVVKSAAPASQSPVFKAIAALSEACDAMPSDPQMRTAALRVLSEAIVDKDSRALAGEHGAVLLVLRCCGGGGSVESVTPEPTSEEMEVALLALHSLIKDSVDNGDRMRDFDAAGIKMLLLRCCPDAATAAAAAAVASRTYEKLRSAFACEAASPTGKPSAHCFVTIRWSLSCLQLHHLTATPCFHGFPCAFFMQASSETSRIGLRALLRTLLLQMIRVAGNWLRGLALPQSSACCWTCFKASARWTSPQTALRPLLSRSIPTCFTGFVCSLHARTRFHVGAVVTFFTLFCCDTNRNTSDSMMTRARTLLMPVSTLLSWLKPASCKSL